MQAPVLTGDVRRDRKNQRRSQPWRAIHAWRRRNVGRLSGLKKAVSFKPCAGIFGILFIPAPRAAETKTVSPVIHVSHEPCSARSGKLACQNDLQVTHGTLLEIVTARIAFELRSSCRRHADNVGDFVKHGVNRCVVSNKDPVTDNTCFRFCPETPVNRMTAGYHFD